MVHGAVPRLSPQEYERRCLVHRRLQIATQFGLLRVDNDPNSEPTLLGNNQGTPNRATREGVLVHANIEGIPRDTNYTNNGALR